MTKVFVEQPWLHRVCYLYLEHLEILHLEPIESEHCMLFAQVLNVCIEITIK